MLRFASTEELRVINPKTIPAESCMALNTVNALGVSTMPEAAPQLAL